MSSAETPAVDGVVVEDRSVETDLGTIFARRWSTASLSDTAAVPIVLVHDSLGSVELWRTFPAALASATQRDVIAYDRLGFGRSSAVAEPIGLDFIAAEANRGIGPVLNAFGVQRWIGMGHSVGGAMVVNAAATLAGCAALVTESAQAFVEDRTIAGIEASMQQFAVPGQLERLARYHGDKARWVLDAWTESWRSDAFADWTLDRALRAIECPLLVLHGTLDEYGSLEHPERIVAMSGGPAAMMALEGMHHVPHREHESDIVALVVAFVADHF